MGGSTHAGRPSVDLPEVVLAALAPSVAAHVREAIRRGDYTAADVVGAGEWSDGGDVVVCDVDDGGGRDDTPRMDEDTSDEGNVQCVKCVNVPPRAATPSDDDDEDEVLLAAVLGAIVKRDAAVDTRVTHASTTASAQTAAVVSDAGAQTAAVSSAARPIVASTPSYHPFDDIAAALERRAKVGPKNTLGGSAPRLMAGKGKRPPPDSSAASGHAADDPGCEPNYDAVRRRVPACRFGTPPPRPTPIQPATPPKARPPRTPADRVAPTEVGLPFETGMDAAIADLEAKEREEAEAGRRARATLDPEKLDVVRRKPPATTFARAAGGEKTKRQTSPLRSASETAVSTTQTAVNFALVEPSAPALSFGRSSGRDGAVGLEEGARAAMESSASSDAWWRRPFGKTNQRAPRGSPSRALPDPGAIARALAATRPSASSALGVVRWAPARPPSSPGGVSVASTMSTESADWDGRTVARELRRRAAAESRAAAANRSADRPRVGPLPNDEPCRPRVVTPPAWGPPPKKKTDDAAAAKAKAAARAKAEAKKAAREARREAAETDGMFDPYGVDDDDDDDAAALTWRTSSTEVSRVDAAPAPPVPSDVVTRRRSPAVRFAPPPRRADDDDRAAIRSLREGAVGPGTYHRAAGADVAVRKRAPEVSFGARPITAPRASARRDASGGGGVYDADGAAWDAAKGKRVKGVVAFDRAPPRKTAAEEAAENKNTSGGVTKTDPVHVLTEPRVIGGAWAPAPPNTVEPKSDAVDASTLQSALDLDAAAAWDRHVAPSKPAWRFGEAPTDRGGGVGRGQSDTVPWPVLGLDTWSDRALPSGGAVAFDAMIGRADGYEDRRAAREAANHRAPVVGTYKVVEAIDYLRRATPAAVFRLAADRWRTQSKRRRKEGEKEEEKEEEEEDEGPDWLTHEALAAAVNQTRPTAPGWRFLPLAVTQPRPAPGRTPKPGERPELEVRLTLVRKRPPSAPDFSKRPSEDRRDAPASPGRAAALGPGAYDVDYALTEPTPVTVGFSALDRGLLPALDEGETEEGGGPSKEASRSVGEGDALDIDPAAAFATAVARRAGAGAHVDIARMTNPRVDDEKRREARAVAAAGLDAEHGWERVLDDGDGEGSDAASVVREVMAAATAKAARALQPLTAADKLGDPDADLPTRRRLEGGVDFATMTWRVGETSEGRLSLELLSARLGPGAYDASDETTTARRRAPGPADFAKGAARFSHDRYSEDDSDPTNPEDTSGRRTGAFAVDPEGDRVWLDLASAVAAVRPRVDVGGVIHPEHTSGMSDERREPLPYVDAVYDVERALEILRDGAYARAPDFASALNPRAAATAETSADAAGRNPAAPDFYDVDTETALGALAYPRGAGGSTAWGAPSFAPAVGRGEAFYLDAATLRRQEGVADGDRLELDPATADAKTRPRVDKGVLDMSEAAQTGRPEETAPALTSDVDWLYERQLAAAYPRLDAGTGAVDFSKSTAQVRRGVGADAVNRTTDDLDAGCYHDDVSRVDAKAAVTTRRRARAADFSTASGRDAGGTSGGGDVLVLNPRDPWRAPETALEASKAAAIAASDPVAAFKAQVFVRATPRWAHAPADDAGGEGDVLVLPVPHPSGGRRSDVDGHDFGRPAGRGAVFGVGGWTSERVGHALRADPRVPTREGADSEENRGDPEAWRVERRKERVARMMARLPRRGVGAPKPAGDGGGHRRVVIE